MIASIIGWCTIANLLLVTVLRDNAEAAKSSQRLNIGQVRRRLRYAVS